MASQADLVRELARQGFAVNQATVSRDLRELGLVRVPSGTGAYKYAPAPARPSPGKWDRLRHLFAEFASRVDGNESLIVVKTRPGGAPTVALALDELDLDDIVGTVAGDDTILVIPRSTAVKPVLQERLAAFLR